MIRRLSARRGDDDGMALVLVIGVCSVLTIAIVAGIALAVGSMRKARADQDWSGAIAAAYAGIEEYQSRLANDTSYFQYGNPDATFSRGSKVALPTGGATNRAFGIGASGTWADIPGSDGAASYRYEVDTTAYAASGTIKLRSTGRAGGDTRSIVADLKQSGFIDFLYFTDYEIQDPANSGVNEATCVRYAWASRPSTGCSEIAFGSNDVIDGPAHSNDTMRICAATFKGVVTTAYNPARGIRYTAKDSNDRACTGARFTLPNSPAYSPVIGMPATNSQLRQEVRSDLAGEVPRPGCLYTGPTSITFTSNGNMTVRSPWTKATNVIGSPATGGSAPAACGTVGTGANGLGSANGATIKVPEYNVIYVQNVPTVSSDPNFTASNRLPDGLSCTGVGTSSAGNGIGYPMRNEVAPGVYGCRTGDAFVSGTIKGQLTIAAENVVYAVGDIRYSNIDNDILGLIGNNAVWVWNPVDSRNASLLRGSDRRIDAAILSVAHTFQVQNYNKGGDRGTLTVYGAIAQKFRGIVRHGANGYAKNYVYDDRFRYTAPPKFLSPVTTTYGVSLWVEVERVFDETGGYR